MFCAESERPGVVQVVECTRLPVALVVGVDFLNLGGGPESDIDLQLAFWSVDVEYLSGVLSSFSLVQLVVDDGADLVSV